MTPRRLATTAALSLVTLTGILAPPPDAANAIARGRAVQPGEAPWLVALRSRGTVCGGVLVARDRVLTAAHCVAGAEPAKLRVELGDGVVDKETRHLRFDRAVFPPAYKELPSPDAPEDPFRAATVDDLAVLHLTTPVDDVAPLPVATTPPAEGERTVTYGRGRTAKVVVTKDTGPGTPDPGAPPVSPKAAEQVVLGADACNKEYPTLLRVADHLCTLDAPGRSQACGGDSGGPVVVVRNGRPELAGLVTWGGETRMKDCGEGLPDVSERVLPHMGLVTAADPFASPAPWATKRTRVRRADGVLTCVSGPWRPSGAKLTVSWFKPGKPRSEEIAPGVTRLTLGPDKPLPGVHKRSIKARKGQRLGCSVRAETKGGWAEERSYNAV